VKRERERERERELICVKQIARNGRDRYVVVLLFGRKM
jgi:hypothetical protein